MLDNRVFSLLTGIISSWIVTSTIPWQSGIIISTLLTIPPLLFLICARNHLRNVERPDSVKGFRSIVYSAFGIFSMWELCAIVLFGKICFQKILPANDRGVISTDAPRNCLRVLVPLSLSYRMDHCAWDLLRNVVHNVSCTLEFVKLLLYYWMSGLLASDGVKTD